MFLEAAPSIAPETRYFLHVVGGFAVAQPLWRATLRRRKWMEETNLTAR